jgi:ATP-dependent Clp protease protease subunit
MPIGVPKVPYRMPEMISAQWVYIIAYTENDFILCQNLDDELANQLIELCFT